MGSEMCIRDSLCTYHMYILEYILFERSEFLIATSQKKNMCVCSTNLGFSGEKKLCVCSTNLGFSEVRIMYQIRMYLVSAGRNLYVRTLCSRYVGTWYHPAEIYTYVLYVPPVDAHV